MCTCEDINIKGQHQKQQHNNHNSECLYSMFANYHTCVVLWSSVCYIGGWNCPKFIHKSKCNEFLIRHIKLYLLTYLHTFLSVDRELML